MQFFKIAVFITRLFGIHLLLSAFAISTEIANALHNLGNTKFDSVKSQYTALATMSLVRLIVFAVAGIVCLVRSKALARLLTKDLDEQ